VAAEEALRQIDVYRATGAPPKEIAALIVAGKAKDSDNALTAFFARLSFATYRAALTPDQARQLAAQGCDALATTIPYSPSRPRISLANAVRHLISWKRIRWSAWTSC